MHIRSTLNIAGYDSYFGTGLASPRSVGTSNGGLQVNMLKSFLHDESGATAIEYGLIAAGIAVTLIAVLKSVGKDLTSTFRSLKKAV